MSALTLIRNPVVYALRRTVWSSKMLRRALVIVCVLAAAAGSATAQSNRIDTVTPTAPELAPYGKYAIGVRTVQAT
ncbi:MAG TPA: hypothetical protein VGP77_07165, partial [Vicinamibacterales bacterium]|nr:hypothetical protein [Vicinamibacterales bacterium]